ncbi:hypothetical protein [Flavobacterium sp. FlaQc-47]|uniref:hypothetical protein n=1 Tax=Flavobacterium sp. FlaQc-47 TaxID=3374180 RepID=UPI0037566CE7
MQSISPWTATVQSDLENSTVLWEKKFRDYTFQLYNTGDSLWIVTLWPNQGKMAFRAAFGLNSCFEVTNLFDDGQAIVINMTTRIGKYEVTIDFPNGLSPLLHYKTSFKADFPIMIPFWPRDILPLTESGNVENTFGNIHTHQIGARSGHLFLSMTKPKTGSVFYFQDLGSLSAYCEATGTSVAEKVGGDWPEIGFQLPLTENLPLPSDQDYILSDAYVLFSEQIAEDDIQVTHQFLNNLGEIYKCLPHPETEYHNWLEIAKKCQEDLYHNKGCWTQTNGIPYLNAYLCDYDTPSEVMVQLAVLMPLKEHMEWTGEKHPLFDDLQKGISAFYDGDIKTINRWLPALYDKLDGSEEQKEKMVMDSWYLHHPLMNLSRLALKGEKFAEKLLLDSIQFAIKVARHFDYEWPVFYKMDTLEVIKEETVPGQGGEKDVPGSYAHLMLLVYELTKDELYLREAKKAVKKLIGLGFQIFYQANNTAFSAGALLDLYKITGEKMYLDLSFACLAGLFKNMQIWDCQYGFGKNYPNYFSIFPLNDAPYTAVYEEHEVYAKFCEYMIKAEDVDILPALKILLPEFIKYSVTRMPYYYPSQLPEEMLSDEVKTGELQPKLWIPLEDLYTGWEKSGQVGQEVYGGGVAFGVVPRQYCKVKGEDFLIFFDYPIKGFKKVKNAITFKTLGSEEFSCNVKIIYPKKIQKNVKVTQNKKEMECSFSDPAILHYKIAGNSQVKIVW